MIASGPVSADTHVYIRRQPLDMVVNSRLTIMEEHQHNAGSEVLQEAHQHDESKVYHQHDESRPEINSAAAQASILNTILNAIHNTIYNTIPNTQYSIQYSCSSLDTAAPTNPWWLLLTALVLIWPTSRVNEFWCKSSGAIEFWCK